MLTAAVLGGVFASPSVSSILSTVLAVTGTGIRSKLLAESICLLNTRWMLNDCEKLHG